MKRAAAILLTLLALAQSAGAVDVIWYSDQEPVEEAVFAESGPASAVLPEITAPSAILTEKETGTVLWEKNADEVREPASVTKVMTILLIVEALERGEIGLEDTVRTSTYASSMGGSQIFLKEGEEMSLRDMLKSIVVASANDAAVAAAERLCGSEEAFVARMNERAGELGMTNTVFRNCTGLLDDPEHVTTARDVAAMSRELIRHDLVKEFTSIWTDTVRDGEFGLTNTNKLIRYYDGATGLKTGFTQRSRYCLSATAERDGVEYIAVVMGEETSAERFQSAKTLLSYAFANYTLTSAAPQEPIPPLPVRLGRTPYVQPVAEGAGRLLVTKAQAGDITRELTLPEELTAPVEPGQRIGTLTVKSGGETLGTFPVVSPDGAERLGWSELFLKILAGVFAGRL